MKMEMMKKAQNNYLYAKAILEFYEEQEREFEVNFMQKKNIINDDGTIAKNVYMIDNDELFEKINKEYEAAVTGCGLWNKVISARDNFKNAETELLKCALDIIPGTMKDVKTTLEKAVKTNFKIREQVIENTLKLSTSNMSN